MKIKLSQPAQIYKRLASLSSLSRKIKQLAKPSTVVLSEPVVQQDRQGNTFFHYPLLEEIPFSAYKCYSASLPTAQPHGATITEADYEDAGITSQCPPSWVTEQIPLSVYSQEDEQG